MAYRVLKHMMVAATSIVLVRAQRSNIVPADLQAGFNKETQIQVSYTGEAVNGFKDGTSFQKTAVANEPTFALGDSSGIAPSTLYTIIMVDTTCPNALKLHYARANFKNNFDITNIDTKSAASQAYKAPGSLGEVGDNRQYSFLMYTNPGLKQINQLKLPAEGENFNVKQFQDDNGLPDADAGVGMVVKLGGTADCGGDQANTLPASLPTPRPAPSTLAQPSIASSSSTAALSSISGVFSNATTSVQQSSTIASATQSGTPGDDAGVSTPVSSADSGLETAPSPPPSGPITITSIITLSSARPGSTGSSTSSSSPALATANAASSLVAGSCTMGALIASFWALMW
ncbi:hypothetical protein ACN47E_006657 [Coniothyrium glycines]